MTNVSWKPNTSHPHMLFFFKYWIFYGLAINCSLQQIGHTDVYPSNVKIEIIISFG